MDRTTPRVGSERVAARALTSSHATLAANIGAAERSPDGFAHGDDRVFARCWRVIPHVNLDSVRDEAHGAMPSVLDRPRATATSARAPSAGASDWAMRRSRRSPVVSRISRLMTSSVCPSRCRTLIASSWRRWR